MGPPICGMSAVFLFNMGIKSITLCYHRPPGAYGSKRAKTMHAALASMFVEEISVIQEKRYKMGRIGHSTVWGEVFAISCN